MRMWFYNEKLKKWYHPDGCTSTNPAESMPTVEEHYALKEIMLKALALEEETRKLAPVKEPDQKPSPCNCGGFRQAR